MSKKIEYVVEVRVSAEEDGQAIAFVKAVQKWCEDEEQTLVETSGVSLGPWPRDSETLSDGQIKKRAAKLLQRHSAYSIGDCDVAIAEINGIVSAA